MFTSSHYNKKFFFLLLFLSGFIGTIIPFLNNCLLSSDKLISIYVGTIYISILLYCVLLISFRALVKILINPIYLFLVFLSAFYLSGIIGISDYRGYINIGFWLRLLITSVASFYFGTILYNFLNRINFKKKKYNK
ncbi:hypothetical protein CEJ87_13715 [Caldifermentibacillus hisashii]|nr:hypothetical protein CEJ87_13715 [Caldifermentibacillus hisashii]